MHLHSALCKISLIKKGLKSFDRRLQTCCHWMHWTTGFPGLADDVPLHTVHLEDFLPDLQALIAHFHLSYDTRKLRSTADEMELFSTVVSSNGELILLTFKKALQYLRLCTITGLSVSPGVEGVPNNFQTTRADENVSSVRRYGGEAEPVGEEERKFGSEEGGQLDPLHSGRTE